MQKSVGAVGSWGFRLVSLRVARADGGSSLDRLQMARADGGEVLAVGK